MLIEPAAPSASTYASWVLSGVALVLILVLHLLPALLAGLLVYELVHLLAPTISRWFSNQRAKLVAVLLLSALVVGAITAGVTGAIVFFKSDASSLSALLTKMAEIVAGSRGVLPQWLVEQMPESRDDIREAIAEWFRGHAAEVQTIGRDAVRVTIYALFGMIMGAMVALHEAMPHEPRGPLAAELIERIDRLGDAFRRYAFAQIRISLVNSILPGARVNRVAASRAAPRR